VEPWTARLAAVLGDRPTVRAAAQDVLLRYAEPQRKLPQVHEYQHVDDADWRSGRAAALGA
jgi:hypothetical protein